MKKKYKFISMSLVIIILLTYAVSATNTVTTQTEPQEPNDPTLGTSSLMAEPVTLIQR